MIAVFADCVEMKPLDVSVMFKVLNSGDVWVVELGIGHALPMSLEGCGSVRSFVRLTKGV